MKRIYAIVIVLGLALLPMFAQQRPAQQPYQNVAWPIEERAADLFSRMTLEEKITEITGGHRGDRGLLDTSGKLPYKTGEELFKEIYRLETLMNARERDEVAQLYVHQ